MNDLHRLVGGILLVAGTTIGAGMLALPVVTGFAGFMPSIALFVLYWIYMTFTAFLMLEVNLWVGEHTNLITMAKRTLGKTGAAVSWIIYLFLLYTLTTAYVAGGGMIFLEIIQAFTGYTLPAWMGPLPLLLILGLFVFQGPRSVDYVNQMLMIGLAITYGIMVVFLTPHLETSLLGHVNWPALGIAVSIVSTSFGFHIIIPTLTDYLHRDFKHIRLVLIIGGLIPLLIYISWEALTLGIIPLTGTMGLSEGYQKGLDGATLLASWLERPDLIFVARLFSLFAIITSFLGVTLSLRDFLADGLEIRKTVQGRIILYFLTFFPPLILTFTNPRAFLDALEYAGAFGVMTLLGLLPVLMVWKGRYFQNRTGPYRTPGGKFALGIALAISIGVIGLEIVNKAL